MENPDFIVPPPGLFAPRNSDDESTAKVAPKKPLGVVPPASVGEAPAADAAPPTGPAPTVPALAIPAFVATPLGAPPRAPAAPAGIVVPEAVVPEAVVLEAVVLEAAVPVAVVPDAVIPDPASWQLVLADGQSIPVTGSIVLGRDPAPVTRRAATMVSVNDPARSVSKSHALVELIDGDLWITDLHSTNGVSIVDRSGERTPLDPGIRTALVAHQTLSLGEFTVAVTQA